MLACFDNVPPMKIKVIMAGHNTQIPNTFAKRPLLITDGR